jgi:alkanesulfonate monooxygenase SsuD/methylene tetrahydromethanopterin reductase-like flavin-dependent oxidoreductase (luciferase family)
MIERFGVTIDWRGANLQALTTIALQADHSGSGYFWVPEAWGLEAFSTLGHLLSITKRIKIGTGIVNVFSRSAATIAMGCATLNQLAPQRFLLGLGTSGPGLIESFHGFKFERAFRRTQEYAEAIRQIESGDEIDYDGKILKLSRFRLFTAAVKPAVPIYIGAIGEKNLEFAGRISDGALVTLYPISKFAYCRDLVNKESPAKNKKVFAYIPFRVIHNEREQVMARDEVARFISFYIASMGKYYATNLVKLGYQKEVDQITSEAAAGRGTSELAKILTEQFINDFALIGTADQLIDRIAKMPDGVHPVFAFPSSTPAEGDASARALREVSAELASRKPRAI